MEIDISRKALKGVFDIEQYCKDNGINVEEVTKLSCYSNELTKLKGLNKLVNLKVLSCNFNELTELDVSKLVNLEELCCNYNKLTELKGLDKHLSCNNNIVNLYVKGPAVKIKVK